LNSLGQPANVGKDIGEFSCLVEILIRKKDLFILRSPFVVLFVVYSVRGSTKNKFLRVREVKKFEKHCIIVT